jgi:hypothetical protein
MTAQKRSRADLTPLVDPTGIVAKEGTILCKPLPTWNHFSQILFGMVCRFWSEPLHFVVLFIAYINML